MSDFDKEIKELKTHVRYYAGKGAFLAGGAITAKLTGNTINDFDIYFKDKNSFLEALEGVYIDGFWNLAITPRAATFSDHGTVFQLMCFDWFPTAKDIFDKFDFTINMAAIDLETGEFFKHDDFVRDIMSKTLRFNHGTSFPIGSAMRVRKYTDRGYKIENSEYLKIITAVAMMKLNNWDDLRNQIGGQYGEAAALDTSKEFTLDNAIESINKALNVEFPQVKFQTAANFNEARKVIFGD